MKKFISPWAHETKSQQDKSNPGRTETTVVNANVGNPNIPIVITVENGIFQNGKDSVDLKPHEFQICKKKNIKNGFGKVEMKYFTGRKWEIFSKKFSLLDSSSAQTIAGSIAKIPPGIFCDSNSNECHSAFYTRTASNHLAYGDENPETMYQIIRNGGKKNI